MKCLILAAGYATRLYPLTENFPKPLLEVGGRTILDHLLDDLDATGLIDGYIVVTNHRFAPVFEEWAVRRAAVPGAVVPGAALGPALPGSAVEPARHGAPITVIDDGTSSNETRLGAVPDIALGIRSCDVRDDLLVMAGDNLLTFSLGGFIDYARRKGTSCIMCYYEPDENRLQRCGVVEKGDDGMVISMEEKPARPKSHWCCPPFYILRREDLPLVAEGLDAGCGTDAPGSFISWLCTRTPIHAWQMPGPRFDIGSLASYEYARKQYEGL